MSTKLKSVKGMVKITKEIVKRWKLPPWRGPLRTNTKMKQLGEAIKSGSVFTLGTLCLGRIGKKTYLIDGQRRISAFLASGVPVVLASIHTRKFTNIREMTKASLLQHCC